MVLAELLTANSLKVAAIPVVAGVIGYATNWLAVRMMFEPLAFRGVGRIGWQGVIPSKAAKMASISVDTGLAKLGSLSDFYKQLDPDRIAEHVVAASRDDVHALVEEVMGREHPDLWRDLPPRLKEAVHRRVEEEMPRLVTGITHDIGEHIESLMDLKLMVVRHLRDDPALVNRMFREVGEKEFRFIVNSGLWFGFALGLVQMALWIAWPTALVLPVAGLLVGFATNWLALRIIFSPIEPRTILGREVQGLFLKRQHEVADVYADLVSQNVLTLGNIVGEMLEGPYADRTRALIGSHLRPAIDDAAGRLAPVVRRALGPVEYDAIGEGLANDGVDVALGTFADPDFNRDRGAVLGRHIGDRMRDLTPREFATMLRSAFEEDEWQLIAVGAVLGGLAGLGQLVFVFGGAG